MTARTSVFRAMLSLGLLMALGCVPVEFVSDVPEELELLADELVELEKTRKELHTDLGEPIAVSDDATVEVFRAASGHDVGTLVWLGPIPPLPFPPFSGLGDVTGYLMVRYDSDEVVRESVTGFTAEWETEYSDRGDHREMSLSLRPFVFDARYCWPTYQESLFAPLPARWPPLSSDDCRLLFIPPSENFHSGSPRKLYIDESLALTYTAETLHRWPHGDPPTKIRALHQFILPAGSHTAYVQMQDYEEERFATSWNCSEGETTYLYDNVGLGDRPELKSWWQSGWGPVGSLDMGSEINLKSSDRKLAIYHNVLTHNLKRID